MVEALQKTKTTCRGGVFDGVTCYNGKGDPFCHSGDVVSLEHSTQRRQIDAILPILQSGTDAQRQQVVDALNSDGVFQVEQSRAGSGHSSGHYNKNHHRKHGKNGGSSRSR